jgi:hypothetical protein
MSEKKSGLLARFVFCAILAAALDQSVPAQVAASPPANPAAPSSTASPEQESEPRPPTQQDVAQLKAVEDSPGSVLGWVAIVGNFAYAGFILAPTGNTGSSMLATNTSGKWEYITDDGGAFSPGEMVDTVPSMPLPVAQALAEQALRDEVYWTANARGPKWDKKVQTYFDYNTQGYEAANQGDFDAAITAWTEAAAIDLGDSKSCGDLAQRLEIRAANDAKARMNELQLTKEAAVSWFQQHQTELWKTRKGCDLP